jgi:hypothetical protein
MVVDGDVGTAQIISVSGFDLSDGFLTYHMAADSSTQEYSSSPLSRLDCLGPTRLPWADSAALGQPVLPDADSADRSRLVHPRAL